MIIFGNESRFAPLDELFPHWPWNRRTLTWLWLVLSDAGLPLSPDEFGVSDMHYRMANYIDRERYEKKLDDDRVISMLPEHEMQWIDKDGRQVQWLLHELLDRLRERESLQLPRRPVQLTPREEFIAIIDYLRDSATRKRSLLDGLRRDWTQHITNDKHFTWFKLTNQKLRCETAWDWYQQEHRRVVRDAPKFKKLDDVFLCLDISDFTLDEKRFHLEEIKKAFHRNQVKDRLKDKKQTNLGLNEKVRSQLNSLARREQLTLVQVVESLIQNAFINGMPQSPFKAASQDGTSTSNSGMPLSESDELPPH